MSRFPTTRLRRLRHLPSVRALVRGTTLMPGKLILPMFVRDGADRNEIASMPGVYQLSLDAFSKELPEIEALGLGGIILFGIPSEKDALGTAASRQTGIVQRAVKAAKQIAPKLLVMTDVCFCEYTDHGHCGVVNKKHGEMDVDNDATLEL